MLNIREALSSWDGKSVDTLNDLYCRFSHDSSFIQTIISFIESTNAQTSTKKGVTWLLKKHLESGGSLSLSHQNLIYASLHPDEHWENRLHLLQCIPYIPVPPGKVKHLEDFLRKSLQDSNKFIRAWAYNGFYDLSQQFPEYKEEAEHFLTLAMKDEAPSVKARIRNIMKR